MLNFQTNNGLFRLSFHIQKIAYFLSQQRYTPRITTMFPSILPLTENIEKLFSLQSHFYCTAFSFNHTFTAQLFFFYNHIFTAQLFFFFAINNFTALLFLSIIFLPHSFFFFFCNPFTAQLFFFFCNQQFYRTAFLFNHSFTAQLFFYNHIFKALLFFFFTINTFTALQIILRH